MEYHYKAFISYRHAELDTKVAVEIQNRIERYIIPGSIRRELGIKSIGRVFRDKDELPSTSDLNDNIKNAIRNSEYLICICSPRYIESIWCRKEIEFFLESHDKHHVLTVLAEGDPYEVVPDILCSETVTVKDENGNDVTIETKLEPLSCDYRGDRHRARTEEFPRLAAVLIGCRYADLRQKMRKRRMRLTAAAAAFASALAAYFVWSYINIQINYRQSLINQSQYLASSAQDALDDNDNILAAQLSLAALPDQGRNRPVVPEAVYTLSQAIGAYQSKQTLNFRGVASYSMENGTLSYFAITPDAHYLAMVSSGGDVEVYDLAENRKLFALSTYSLLGKASDRAISCGNDRFLIYSQYENDVAMISCSDGGLLWHQKFEGTGRRILILGEDNTSRIMILDREEALILDSANGDILNRLMIEEESGGAASKVYNAGLESARRCAVVSTEDACCSILCAEDSDKLYDRATGILSYYYETGKTVWTPLEPESYKFEGISRDTDGRLLLAYIEEQSEHGINNYYQLSYASSSSIYENGKVSLLMVQEGTGEALWQNSIEYTNGWESAYSCFEIRTIPGKDDHPARKVVLAAIFNKAALFDDSDGAKIKEITLSDRVVSVDQQNDWEPYVRVNGASGTQYYFDYYSKQYTGLTYMEGEVDNNFFYHARKAYDEVSQFIVLQGSTIRVFKAEQGDDEFTLMGLEEPEGTFWFDYILGSRLVRINDKYKIYIYDLETKEKLHEIELDGEYYYSYLGSPADNSCFYMTTSEDYTHKTMLRVDMEDGTCENVDITRNDVLTGAGKWEFDCFNNVVAGDYIFYRAANYNSMVSYWFRYSMKDGSCVMLELPYYEDLSSNDKVDSRFLFAEDGSRGVLYFDNAIYLADFRSGTVTAVDAEIPGVTYGTRRESDGMFAYCYQGSQEGDNRKELHVFDAAGSELWKIDNLAEKISAMRFFGDKLVVSTEGKRLYAYDARKGEQTGVIDLGSKLDHKSVRIYDGGSGDLVIDGRGTVYMVNYENWALTGVARETIAYCPALKWIISSTDGTGKVLGYCRYYSVSDLVEKGKAFAGEQTMSEANMAKYGVNQ